MHREPIADYFEAHKDINVLPSHITIEVLKCKGSF